MVGKIIIVHKPEWCGYQPRQCTRHCRLALRSSGGEGGEGEMGIDESAIPLQHIALSCGI